MGRHGAPPPQASVPAGRRLLAGIVTWGERVLLGVAAGGGTWGVLQWAGTTSATALWAAAGVAVVVPAAAWAASRLPGHETSHDTSHGAGHGAHGAHEGHDRH